MNGTGGIPAVHGGEDVNAEEMQQRIDEMVDQLGRTLGKPPAAQREMLRTLEGIVRNNLRLPEYASAFACAANLLPDEDLPTVIRELRGVLLGIKRDQYGG